MKIGIVGVGGVGSATAFSLVMRGIARKIVLVDVNKDRAIAEAEDIAHASPFAEATKIKAGDYSDLAGTDVVIITAGASQKPGEPRTSLLERNVRIFESIIPEVAKNAPDCIMLIVSNPVDVMTRVALEISGFPKQRVIGSGTVLDSSRFRTLLGYHLGVSPKSVHANVLGEHGDSEVLIWSSAVAGSEQIEDLSHKIGKPLCSEIKARIDDEVRNSAYKIIEGKGSTNYGIAGAVSRICRAISQNEYAILSLSTLHEEIEGSEDICISYPCVVGKRGVHNEIYPNLSVDEHAALAKSAKLVHEYTMEALSFIKK